MQLNCVDVLGLRYWLIGNGCLQILTELRILFVGLLLLGCLHLQFLVLFRLFALFIRLLDDNLRLKLGQCVRRENSVDEGNFTVRYHVELVNTIHLNLLDS